MILAAAPIRQEIKIPLCAADALQLDALLLDSPFHCWRSYQPRYVNSYYYDSGRSGDYLDNLTGLAQRTKLRFRWYGAIEGRHPVALERKHKTGATSHKDVTQLGERTTGLPDFRAAEALAGATLDPALARDVAMRPQRRLFVRYQRRYLAGHNDVRVTIDRDICYADGRERRPLLVTSPVHTVLELKFPPGQGESAGRLLEGLPFRSFRHSKYVIGVKVSGG
jgi:VTC domain